MYTITEVPYELKTLREENLKLGILSKEGIEAFDRILGARFPQVVVSTQDFLNYLERESSFSLKKELEETNRTKSTHQRPDLNTDYVAPGNETEQVLTEIWQQLLGIEQVGIHDDFFELGGDSLLGIQIISRIRARFYMNLSVGELFDEPTVAGIADYVEKNRGAVQKLQTPHSIIEGDREEGEI